MQTNAAVLVITDSEGDDAQDLHVLQPSIAATGNDHLLFNLQMNTVKERRTWAGGILDV